MKPHNHSKVIKAFADGQECQFEGYAHQWYLINRISDFDIYEKVRIKPKPETKEYYDEDTFDVQYLYAYKDNKYGVIRFVSKKVFNLIDWEYMGKVRLEK